MTSKATSAASSTVNHRITMPRESWAAAEERAKALGLSVEAYLIGLTERDTAGVVRFTPDADVASSLDKLRFSGGNLNKALNEALRCSFDLDERARQIAENLVGRKPAPAVPENEPQRFVRFASLSSGGRLVLQLSPGATRLLRTAVEYFDGGDALAYWEDAIDSRLQSDADGLSGAYSEVGNDDQQPKPTTTPAAA